MIRISRGIGHTDKMRKYKIYIDNIHMGSIGQNETREFAVESGEHTVFAKIDWCKSPVIRVTVKDSPIDLQVGPAMNASHTRSSMAMLKYITVNRNQYLWIKQSE